MRAEDILETTVQGNSIDWLESQGCLCLRYGKDGVGDYLVFLPVKHGEWPRCIFMEFKRPKGGRIRPSQKLFAQKWPQAFVKSLEHAQKLFHEAMEGYGSLATTED